jgi:hypothetical protein
MNIKDHYLMSTLSKCVDSFIENITVTDRQESSITQSVRNLDGHLKNKEAKMGVVRIVVLDPDVWKDEYGRRSSPKAVLTSMRNYLNGLSDYEDKVSQDRPCVTIELTDKHIDLLPCFEEIGGGYVMPSADLEFWVSTYPKQLEHDLKTATSACRFVKGIIKAVKYWKRADDVPIPSYHVEEVTISISRIVTIPDHVTGIMESFKQAETYLIPSKFNTDNAYERAIRKVQQVNGRLAQAEEHLGRDQVDEALAIWKDVFGSDFKVLDLNEAKNFSNALRNGTMHTTSTGMLSTTTGRAIPASAGYYSSTENE